MTDSKTKIKEFIRSGIMEMYVAGNVTESEKREVEEMASKHPEIKNELELRKKAFHGYERINKHKK